MIKEIIYVKFIIKYCIKCKKNICFACDEHKNHKFEDLGNLLPNIDEKKKF